MKTKSFKPKIESVYQIQGFVKKKLSTFNSNENKLLKIDLLIEEIVINIVKYGCKGIKNSIIDITIETSDGNVILEISDNGVAFNPLDQEEPDIEAGLDKRRPGGLGIFLVQQIAKEIQYVRQDNKNIIRLCLDL
jgi:anti-sigma regulatory factor (Ser/Thr protein kinase)